MDNEFEKYDAFEKRLTENYPNMFSQPYGGICVGEGWWPIIENLCATIQGHINWKNKDQEVVPQIVVGQIKEKFGRLRFYLSREDDVMHGMVSMAEYMSAHICETCGERGELRAGSWLVTLCDMHHQARTGKIPHGHT